MTEHDAQPAAQTAEEREAQLAAREAALAAREAELAAREAEAAQGSAPHKGGLLNNGDPHFKNEKEKIYDHFPLSVHQMDILIRLSWGQPHQLFRAVLNGKEIGGTAPRRVRPRRFFAFLLVLQAQTRPWIRITRIRMGSTNCRYRLNHLDLGSLMPSPVLASAKYLS